MTQELRATLVKGPGHSFGISAHGSIRALERQLVRAGVADAGVRRDGQILLPLAHFTKTRNALNGWLVDVEHALQDEIDQTQSGVASLLEARSAVAHVLGTPAGELLGDVAERDRLDPHQVQAVAAATHPAVRGICIFDEQGLGKTITTLFSFHRLKQLGESSHMLVVAPKNVVFEWVRDWHRFFGTTYRCEAILGTERQKRRLLNTRADIYITNFETVIQLNLRLRELLCREHGQSLLVVDESFYVKNSDAQRTKAVKTIRRSAGRCIVLCGTPAPNSPHDIVEQFNVADGGNAFHGVRLPKEHDDARRIVQQVISERGVYLRRLKQDVLPDLPGKTFSRVLVRLQPVQEGAYRAALQELIRDLQGANDIAFRKEITSFMARRTALLQICSNPSSVLVGYTETPAKLLALDEILEELIARRHEKVIVWSFFTASLEAVLNRFQRFNPVRLDGKVMDLGARRDAIRRFQEDDTTMLFVGNPAAAGAGLTLHRARYAVYESFSNQGAHYFQSLDRIHRRGQQRPVEYLILLCDSTIEGQQYDVLRRKERAAQALLRDRLQQPVTRTAMLGELLASAELLGIDHHKEEASSAPEPS